MGEVPEHCTVICTYEMVLKYVELNRDSLCDVLEVRGWRTHLEVQTLPLQLFARARTMYTDNVHIGDVHRQEGWG